MVAQYCNQWPNKKYKPEVKVHLHHAHYTQQTRDVEPMLGQRRRRWANHITDGTNVTACWVPLMSGTSMSGGSLLFALAPFYSYLNRNQRTARPK